MKVDAAAVMNTSLPTGRASVLKSISRASSIFVIVGGGLVVGGWVFDVAFLKSVSREWVTMTVNTAVCFSLTGISLWCLHEEQAALQLRRLGQVCAAFVILVALLVLGEHLFAVDFGIDQLLMRQPPTTKGLGVPGRMSGATAFGFLITGFALLGIVRENRQEYRLAQTLAPLTALMGLLVIAGYLFGVESLYALSPFSSMAVHTALLFIAISVGILCARGGIGLLRLLATDGAGSTMARILLPFAVVVPVLFAWLRLRGERAGLYGFEFGLALFATSNVILFTILIWFTAVSLNRGENKRKRAEETLRESAERLAVAVGASNVGLWEWNIQTNEVYFSPQWKSQIGYRDDEIPNRFEEWENLLHPEDRAAAQARVQNYIREPTAYFESEFRLRHKDGTYRWIYTRAQLFRDESSRPLRMFGCHLDITERNHAEAALRERQEQLQLFVEHSPAAIAMFDRDMIYLVVSRRWLDDYRLGNQPVIGRSHYDIFPEIPQRWIEIHRRCLAGAVEKSDEDPFVRADGKTDWLRWEVRPWHLSNGSIGGIVIFSEDITAQKQAAEALRESEERYRRIVDLSPDAITVHEAGKWVFANAAAAHILGFENPAQLVGQSILDFMHPDVHREVKARWKQLYEDKQAVGMANLKMLRPDGAIVYLETRAVPVDWHGHPAAQVVARDVTERIRAQEKLRQSEQAYSMLVKNIKGAAYHCRNDKEWTIEFISEGCFDITGYRSNEFIENRVTSLGAIMHPDDAQPIWEKCQAKLASRLSCSNEYRIIHRCGEVRWVWDQAQGNYSETGDLLSIEGLITDITDRKRTDQMMREYTKRLRGLSRRLLEVEESERRKINRELHDRIGQNLSALSLSVGLIQSGLSKGSQRAVGARFDMAQKLLESATAQVRDVMAELHPPALDDFGLLAALHTYADSLCASVNMKVSVAGENLVPRLSPVVELAMFRVAQEALANAAKHAQATRVKVALAETQNKVTLAIADDGRGFDTSVADESKASWGFTIMRERAEAIGANLRIESEPRRGTRVIVEVTRETE